MWPLFGPCASIKGANPTNKSRNHTGVGEGCDFASGTAVVLKTPKLFFGIRDRSAPIPLHNSFALSTFYCTLVC